MANKRHSGTSVRRGKVITPRRKKLVHAYSRRCMWCWQCFYDGKWTQAQFEAFREWQKGFLRAPQYTGEAKRVVEK
jgi:hypothetical protein